MSDFGQMQANRETWDNDADCQKLSIQIRDCLIIIALESLCLAQVVAETPIHGTLLQDRDRIHSVHRFIAEQPGEGPIAMIFLAWSVALHALPDELLPPETGDESMATELASRSLKQGLFMWLEAILTGEEADSAYKRNVVKGRSRL